MFSQNTSLLISSNCLKFFIDLFTFVEKSLQNLYVLEIFSWCYRSFEFSRNQVTMEDCTIFCFKQNTFVLCSNQMSQNNSPNFQ